MIKTLQIALISLAINLGTTFCASAQTYTFDQFLHALGQVESSGNPNALNKSEDARGIYQIRRIYVIDCQRFAPEQNFKHQDAYNPAKAKLMVAEYMENYAKIDVDKPLTMAMMEKMARIHNGGPKGHKKTATINYWNKVKKELLNAN